MYFVMYAYINAYVSYGNSYYSDEMYFNILKSRV